MEAWIYIWLVVQVNNFWLGNGIQLSKYISKVFRDYICTDDTFAIGYELYKRW